MALTQRQQFILQIVRQNQPITGEGIAKQLQVTRAALRSDLSILTMMGCLKAKPRVGYFYQEQSNGIDVMKKLEEYQVKDVISRPVLVSEACSVYDAVVTLFTEDAGTLIVVNQEGNLTGIVSRKDLLKATMGNAGIPQIPVSVIMTRMPNVVYVRKGDSVLHALSRIVEHEVDSLPVVETTEHGALAVVGRISKTNFVRLIWDIAVSQKR